MPTQEGQECQVCLDKLEKNLVATPCGHVFHGKCMQQALRINQNCPICRTAIASSNQIIKLFFDISNTQQEQHSTLTPPLQKRQCPPPHITGIGSPDTAEGTTSAQTSIFSPFDRGNLSQRNMTRSVFGSENLGTHQERDQSTAPPVFGTMSSSSTFSNTLNPFSTGFGTVTTSGPNAFPIHQGNPFFTGSTLSNTGSTLGNRGNIISSSSGSCFGFGQMRSTNAFGANAATSFPSTLSNGLSPFAVAFGTAPNRTSNSMNNPSRWGNFQIGQALPKPKRRILRAKTSRGGVRR